ncbi:MAG: AmmeMemoRadiSam system radical SAM enzyme [Deltaproteobacteria bacterium]|nr:AmmeMemoRadiSam system radical SAM enzyme [Deltaproteobacteria bacterium]
MNNEVWEKAFSRRDLLKGVASCALLVAVSANPAPALAQRGKKGYINTRLSSHFRTLENQRIQCQLCPRECQVAKGQRGFCGVRENRAGKYYSLVYGNPCAVHPDPIEKKPFYHLLPASISLSIATAGCNLRCKFCENWEISQAKPEDTYNLDLLPEKVVALAKKMGARSIAYTYAEPTIFFEYMIDTAKLARKEGILNVCHSNGFINPGPLKELCQVTDAFNIDLKGFTDDYYSGMTQGRLAPVLQTLKTLKQQGIHLEITNLVIPTKNDNQDVMRPMCAWIRKELGEGTPLHFSRFYPLYKLRTLPPTPVSTLEKSRNTAMDAGLDFAYIGKVPGHEGERTFCPRCKKLLIGRQGYTISEINLSKGKCKFCGKPIPGIWA